MLARASPAAGNTARATGFDRRTLDALGEVLLPASLGAAGQKGAVDAFVAWVDEYAPVAEEMHGYGYADIRYLPSDPAPGWRAQLEGLDLLARRTRQRAFAELDAEGRRATHEARMLTMAERTAKATEAKAKMEDFVARRTKTAESKIALAEAQALADVRAAAAEAAVAAASRVLSQSVTGSVADDLLSKGIADVKAKLN